MEGHERQPVGESVVHLAGDPGSLVGLCLLDSQALVALGPVGSFPQCRE